MVFQEGGSSVLPQPLDLLRMPHGRVAGRFCRALRARHLVPDPSFENAARLGLLGAAPLLEDERYPSIHALIADLNHPLPLENWGDAVLDSRPLPGGMEPLAAVVGCMSSEDQLPCVRYPRRLDVPRRVIPKNPAMQRLRGCLAASTQGKRITYPYVPVLLWQSQHRISQLEAVSPPPATL